MFWQNSEPQVKRDSKSHQVPTFMRLSEVEIWLASGKGQRGLTLASRWGPLLHAPRCTRLWLPSEVGKTASLPKPLMPAPREKIHSFHPKDPPSVIIKIPQQVFHPRNGYRSSSTFSIGSFWNDVEKINKNVCSITKLQFWIMQRSHCNSLWLRGICSCSPRFPGAFQFR